MLNQLNRRDESLPIFFNRKKNESPTHISELLDFAISSTIANLLECRSYFRLDLLVPGFIKDDIEIIINGDVLTIILLNEEQVRFKRSCLLPNTVAKEKIEAIYRDCMVHIKIPKKQ